MLEAVWGREGAPSSVAQEALRLGPDFVSWDHRHHIFI